MLGGLRGPAHLMLPMLLSVHIQQDLSMLTRCFEGAQSGMLQGFVEGLGRPALGLALGPLRLLCGPWDRMLSESLLGLPDLLWRCIFRNSPGLEGRVCRVSGGL